ncbi:hypothetical protein J4459_04040 [Candidatus Woesearchaeota archaeon]|nr:hypothetical protein [Candidatus Woesearchaeota archaeon]
MGNKPIKTYNCGNIRAAIFLNEREVNGNIVGFKTISLSRSFKKKDEEIWRSEVINMRRNDLQKAILVLQKTQEELLLDSKEEEEE